MALCRRIALHPAHLPVLFDALNANPSKTITDLRTGVRILREINKARKACRVDSNGAPIHWIDPEIVETPEEWAEAQAAIDPRTGRSLVPPGSVYDADKRMGVTLSASDHEFAQKSFEEMLPRMSSDKRVSLAIVIAMEGAEKANLD